MEIKFTPGPWDIDFDVDQSPSIWIEAKSNVGVCKIEPCSYDDGLGHRLTDEDWANARLIAAAPELLVALRAIVTAAELHGADSVVFFEARNQALEAIAKAEGR